MNHVMLFITALALLLLLGACQNPKPATSAPGPVVPVGAMKNVMWKGQLQGIIHLDTLQPRQGLYGVGPLQGLQGEIMINNGQAYLSTVLTDSTMQVIPTFDLKAPFFVYGHVNHWRQVPLPDSVRHLASLEAFITQQTAQQTQPFVFKVVGQAQKATIHIQNLPTGTRVSNPKEAHQGQVKYALQNKAIELVGFYSTQHKGVFTHHDTYMHIHLITQDLQQMGHLDALLLAPGQNVLYLPQY